MFFEKRGSLFIGRFAGLFIEPALFHGFSTRIGGVSGPPFDSLNLGERSGDDPGAVRINRERFFKAAGSVESELAIPRQVHGDEVRCVDRPGILENTDGLVTQASGITLSVLVADCVPVFIYDPDHAAIGLVHAGWKGTRLRITEKAVRAMARTFGSEPHNLKAWLGPSIGPCCYEVGEETAAFFPSVYVRNGRLDLWKANHDQLEEAGVQSGDIETAGLCTRCHPKWFFSHRGSGGRAGRMMAVFGIMKECPKKAVEKRNSP